MALSSELISQFAKITNDKGEKKSETIVYGTIVEHGGINYVKIDGSELLTPISTTANTKPGERVTVMIKNHTATVTGNISSPSARIADVNDIKDAADKITEFEIVLANKVDTEELNVQIGRIDDLVSDNVRIKDSLTANEADIDNLQANVLDVTDRLTAAEAEIDDLKVNSLDAETINSTFAKISNLEATNADVHNLEATYGEFASLTTNKFTSIDATIKDLEADKLSAEDIEGRYANIDFSNIGEAAIEHFYSTSGLIKDVIVGDGTITGKLVGVTISGDLIEGNTVVAEKLVIKGEDGLYYKLNTNGMATEAEQTDYNSLNGSIIKAKSITASKISVDDLVAFDATIGGFNISDSSIYSGVKNLVDNTTRGIYLDKDGQVSFGDASNFIKYYKDSNGNYKLEISAQSLSLGSSSKTVETAISDIQEEVTNLKDEASNAQDSADAAQDKAESTDERVSVAETLIQQLSDSISMIVTDENGSSLMTQTESGWTFSMAEINTALNDVSNSLDTLQQGVGDTSNTVNVLEQAVADLGVLAEYIKVTTYEGEPCIELGDLESDFKLLITNTRIMFLEGSGVPAYINNQSLYINKAVVKEEMQQGGFVWKVRSNGNMGLMWKGVVE